MRRWWSTGARPGGRAGLIPDIRDELGMWQFPDSQVEMLRLHTRVIRAYVPKPFNGTATLLLPRAGPLLGPWLNVADLGWAPIARGGVDVQLVRGSHSTVLTDAFAGPLAERIERCIREAEARARLAAPAGAAGREWLALVRRA